MMLAKRKDGTIGRMVRSMGETAVVEDSPLADRRGDLYLSKSSIAENANYIQQLANKKAKEDQVRAEAYASQLQADKIRNARMQTQIQSEQKAAMFNPMNEALKKHFAIVANKTQTETVASTVRADFSDRTEIRDPNAKPALNQYADFRQNRIVGNPLTRDGSYGVVTDYDRIVRGNEDLPIRYAGGTMLQPLYPGDFGYDQMETKKTLSSPMGDIDWGGMWDSAVSQIETQVPAVVANAATQAVQEAIMPPKTAPTQTTVIRNITSAPIAAVNSAANSMGVPPFVLYGTMGLLGIGVLALVFKAVKK